MKKIQALVLDEQKSSVIKKLHELGAVQLLDCRDKLNLPEWKDLLEAPTSSPLLRRITTSIMSLNKVLDLFESVSPERKDGFLKLLFNPTPPKKVLVDDLHGENLLNQVEETLRAVESETHPLSDQLTRLREKINNAQNTQKSIAKLRGIPIDLTYIEETPLTSVFIGTTLTKNIETISNELNSLTEQCLLFEHMPLNPTDSLLLIVCLSKHAAGVANFLRRTGFERIETGGYTGTPEEALSKIQQHLQELYVEEKKLIAELSASSLKFRDQLYALRELLQIEKERAEVYSNLALSGPLCMIEGWVPLKKAGEVTRELDTLTNGLMVITLSEPDNLEDKVPILLDNPPFFRHFELLTKMYSPPKYQEIDPTPLLAITFTLFFAIMLTDALYATLTLAIGVPMVLGGGRYNKMIKDAGVILTAASLVSIIAGALTGGWFGNLLIEYAGIDSLKKLIVIDPMVDVVPFLLFSIAVGVAHLDIGIILGIINHIRNREFKQIFTGHLWLILAQVALLVYYLRTIAPPEDNLLSLYNTLLGIIGTLSLILLILSQKGLFVFGFTGAIGDTLSYARLMALGICTSGIAVTINILAKMSAGLPFLGMILPIVILVVGHLFNWVIQIMGSFVHSIRLHYVEFFGRFYSGGGDEFVPFSIKRNLTQLKMQ